MNSKERVIKTIQKEDVDFVPASFSCHFPAGCGWGDAAVNAHLDFAEQTDVDVLKIMNENLVTPCGEIRCPADWNQIRSFDLKADFIVRELDLVKRLLDANDGKRFVAATIHGALASCIHPAEPVYGYDRMRELMVESYRADKGPVTDAFMRVADGMALLSEEVIRLGCDAVYYAALGGEKRYYSDEEFATLVAPLDKMILKAVRKSGGYTILHICKDDLAMSRYDGYQPYADIVNWGVYEAPMSLAEGREMFPDATIMGGFANRSGVIRDGSIAELKARAKQIVKAFGKKGFIIGADCTLATELPYERVRAIVDAVRDR